MRSGGLDCAGRLHELFFGLDRAGAGHDDDKCRVADFDAAHINDGRLRVELLADHFVGLGDGDNFVHIRQRFKLLHDFRFHGGVGGNADRADNGSFDAFRQVNAVPALFQHLCHVREVLLRRP